MANTALCEVYSAGIILKNRDDLRKTMNTMVSDFEHFRNEYASNSHNINRYLFDYVMAGSKKPVLNNYIDSIEGWPLEEINFKDISPILANPKAFNESISGMCNLINHKPQMIAGVDARGFVFASAMAERLNLGMLLLRKGGKLPPPKIDIQYELEYGLDQLEIKEAKTRGTEIV